MDHNREQGIAPEEVREEALAMMVKETVAMTQ